MPASAPPVLKSLRDLTDEDVSKLFEDKVMERGIKYFEQGRILRPFVYRDGIMAECQGTLPENYYIRVDLHEGNLIASCTCPYALGYCKHIAAVLYGWRKKPGMFKDLGESEDLLKKMEKGPLVETILDMIKYDPDVLYVINLRLLPRLELPGFVEREMENIFSEEYVDYLNVREIAKKLDIFREYAADILKEGDAKVAMVVLRPVIDAIVDHYTSLDDSDGLLRNFFSAVLSLYGDIVRNYRLEGDRRRHMDRAVEWYLLAEWGLERVLRNFIRREVERLKEQKFLLNTVELKLADQKKRLVALGPSYSEEYEYVEERLERLEELRAAIKGLA